MICTNLGEKLVLVNLDEKLVLVNQGENICRLGFCTGSHIA